MKKLYPYFSHGLSKLVRKIIYEIPVMILILDTRLLLKDELKPPWERLELTLEPMFEGLINSSFYLSMMKWIQSRISPRKGIFCMTLFASLTVLSCLIPASLLREKSFIPSFEDHIINYESIVSEIIEDDRLRARIRSESFLISVNSSIHHLNQVKENIFNELFYIYQTNISDGFSKLHAKLLHHESPLELTTRALTKLKKRRKYQESESMEVSKAIALVKDWSKHLDFVSNQLSHCSNITHYKIDQIFLIFNFFHKEEIVHLVQENFISSFEQDVQIQCLYDELLEEIIVDNQSHASLENIRMITNDLIRVYDSDKTGKFDYALESAGGSILTTRCTESLINYKALYMIFGFNVWYPSHNPRVAIQHGTSPGECWAFKGSMGHLVIKLSNYIFPKEISIEHMSKHHAPNQVIDSAPRNFSVYGLISENDEEPMLLGRFSYSENEAPLQSFQVQFPPVQPFSILEVEIHSNHGHPNYTCLYRFRAHGTLFT